MSECVCVCVCVCVFFCFVRSVCARRYVDPDGCIKHTKIKHIKDMGFAVKLAGRENYELYPSLTAVLLACDLFKFFYPNFPKREMLESLRDGEM